MPTKAQRLDRIRELVPDHAIQSQHQLQERLAENGFSVTQATLSRDLAELGVFKGPGGYVLAEMPVAVERSEALLQRTLLRELRSADYSGSMVVLRTDPGHANALAVELDRARLPEVLGTIAGDDTILIVVHRGYTAAKFARKLQDMAGIS